MNLFDILDVVGFVDDIESVTKNRKSFFQFVQNIFFVILFLATIVFLIIEIPYIKRLDSPITFVLIFSLLGIVLTIL